MFRPSGIKWNLAVASFLAAASFAIADVERHPTAAGAFMDLGQIVSGKFVTSNPSDTSDADEQFLSRAGAYFTQSATINERLGIHFTLAGMYFYALREKTNEGLHRFVQPGIGVGQAQAVYKFGDVEDPWSELRFGLFPIKYNPDVKNLGEYLFRSGTYPAIIYGGGWTYVGGADYMAQGFRYSITHLNGALTHDFSLTLERGLQPINDISPAYVLTFKGGSVFEFGAGVMWAHGIPMNDSMLALEDPQNTYVKPGTGHPEAGLPWIYRDSIFREQQDSPHYRTGDSRVRPDGDPLIGTTIDDPNDPNSGETIISETENGIPGEDLGYYTFRGFKVMGRAAINFGSMLGMEESVGQDGFKLYGELALLGVEDQPFFYEKKSERMPVMFGINIPTFGVLDAFSVEAEYLKSRFPNNLQAAFEKKWPLPLPDHNLPFPGHPSDPWTFNLDDPAYTDPNHPDFVEGAREAAIKKFEKDDWRWSVFARKQIVEGFAVTAQVASDHQRQVLFQNYAPKFMNFPTTRFTSDWYYVLRLEVGL